MDKFILIFSVLSLISMVKPELTEEQRKALLKKVTKLASFSPRNNLLNQHFIRGNNEIVYEASKIKEIIDKYKFPESYNFIEAEKPTVHVKDQGNCGSCWAFASTTALAYRFKKQGEDLDLSPQHGISCYIRDCELGDYLINTHFNLVKNGTVTEECLPYSSSNGISIESCPTKCKNGDDIVKYYAKNAYTTSEDYSQENYYDIVTAIIDQLITKGPVESSIIVYQDFSSLISKSNCKDIIYRYDGYSQESGGHAVVIVGYGVENNRYYWIVQNSWGEDFCDGGFVKIEFGQIFIEKVAFSEAYIDDGSEGKEIGITFNEVTPECKLKFKADTDMNGSFEMLFGNKGNFYYQCGPIYPSTNEGICSYEANNDENERDTYKYISHSSLLNKDTYQLDFSSTGNEFNFLGVDFIDSFYEGGNNYYVSEEENHITLLYLNVYSTEKDFLGKIYPNKNINTTLSNCQVINLDSSNSIIYCTLTSDELQYYQESNNLPLSYDILCGAKEEMEATVNRFNSNSYPIFRVKQFMIPDESYINQDSVFYINADMEGSLSNFKSEEFWFGFYVRIEKSGSNSYEILICGGDSPTKLETDYSIYCYLDISANTRIPYDNIYLTPYTFPFEDEDPFQVIIKDNLKGEEYESEDVIRKFSGAFYQNFKKSILFIFALLLFEN